MLRARRALPFLPATFIALIPLLGGWQCGGPPTACPAIYAPVCGSDGVTYGNSCEAGAAGVGVAYEGECAPQLCLSDADCAGGYCNHDRCLSGCAPGMACPAVCYGACEPQSGCYSDADCGPGFVCAYDGGPAPLPAPAPLIAPGAPGPAPTGVCIPVDPGCYTDADCQPGQSCVLDSTTPVPGEAPAGADRIAPPRGTCQYTEPTCTSDADCPAGQICELAMSGGGSMGVPADALIAPTGFCRDPGPTGCRSDSECGAGSRCDTSSCFAAPCEPGAACPDVCYGSCVPAEICWTDTDCGPGRHCNTSGTTMPPPAEDPARPGIIAPPAGYCEDDAACPPVTCDLACTVFQTDASGCPICACAPTYCFADSDCAMGQSCDTSVCLSPCREGETCPAVCYGQCISATDPAMP